MDLGCIPHGCRQRPLAAADDHLEGCLDRVVVAVRDRHRHLDDLALGRLGRRGRAQLIALHLDAHTVRHRWQTALREGESVTVSIVRGRGEVERCGRATELDIEHSSAELRRRIALCGQHRDRDRERARGGSVVTHSPVGHLDRDRILAGEPFLGAVLEGGLIHDQTGAVVMGGIHQIRVRDPCR